MKRLLISSAVLALCSTPAFAQTSDSWTGLYAGIQTGYGWGQAPQPYAYPADSSDFSNSQNAADQGGSEGGIYAGYNYQIGSLVAGVEGDINLDGINGDDQGSGGHVNGVKHRWNADIRARAGLLVGGNTLLYAAGGVSFLNAKATNTSYTPAEEIGTDWTGWNAGGGVEHKFSDHILVRAEYKYANFGHSIARFPVSGYAERINPKINNILVGVAYKF